MNLETLPARRLGDDVSPINERVYDAARALSVAIRLIDQLGLQILAVEADDRGRQRVQIGGDPKNRLKGKIVAVNTANGNFHYKAERYGVEIVWVELGQGAPA